MLNITKLDLQKKYRTTEDELRALKSYIYQLVEELRFRSGNMIEGQGVVAQATGSTDTSALQTMISALEAQVIELRAASVSIPFGQLDSTSTSTVMTAQIPGITELADGACAYIKNGVVTSASGFTLNINNLGAKPVYQTLAAATRTTTAFNANYTMLFVYNSSRVEGGCWDMFYGFNSDTNTIAYNIRRNTAAQTMKSVLYRYQIVFTSPDGTKLIPANGVSNNTGTSKTLTTEVFDPFAPIFYYSTTSTVAADAAAPNGYLYNQYQGIDFRRAFNAGSTLVAGKPLYLRCKPLTDGTVRLYGNDCLVQSLPSTADGMVYIYIGTASSTTSGSLDLCKPIYEYADGSIRLWTHAAAHEKITNSEIETILAS